MRHVARKRFGQNFLVDRAVIRRIVDTISPRQGELLIEIGPGQAALTDPLLEAQADLLAVELDRDLADQLDERFAHHPNFQLRRGDALETDFASLAKGRPYRLVGNLPYNISTPLIFHLLDQSPAPRDMFFMLQKEVVDRLAASPGTRDWGRLSIMCQNRCRVTPLFEVPPTAFRPAPKVVSAMVRLEPLPEPRSGSAMLAPLDRIVRQAFSQRRKTLRNSLSGLLNPADIEAAGIDPSWRPEQLDLAAFIALASRICA